MGVVGSWPWALRCLASPMVPRPMLPDTSVGTALELLTSIACPKNGSLATPKASPKGTVPTRHTMNGSAPIHATRNRAAANMQGPPKGYICSQIFFSSSLFLPLEIQIMSTLFFLKVSVDDWSLRQFLHQSYPKQH